jgi:hypothetical protein
MGDAAVSTKLSRLETCDKRPSRKEKARAAEVQRRRHRRPFMTALLQYSERMQRALPVAVGLRLGIGASVRIVPIGMRSIQEVKIRRLPNWPS